jgi:hypothetical protein
MLRHLWISNKYQFYGFWFEDSNSWSTAIRLFRIMSIPTTFCLLRVLTSEMLARRLPVFTLLLWKRQHICLPDHVISMECKALDFRCQCTQQKLQSICAVLTFDLQLKKILTFSVNYSQTLTKFNELMTLFKISENSSYSG